MSTVECIQCWFCGLELHIFCQCLYKGCWVGLYHQLLLMIFVFICLMVSNILSYYIGFFFVVPCCGVRYDFRIKTLFVHRCVKHVITMRVTRRVSYKRQELLTNCEHLNSPLFLVGFVLLIFLVFCVVFLCFICLRYVSCLPNVASISGLFILDCPFRFL
jgi:hypothetical protein